VPILFHDFETRSTLDLSEVGAWKYACHKSTDMWCCAYAVDDGPIQLWIPGDPVPPEFIEAARNPDWTTSAFGDHFERLITQHIMVSRYDWPLVPIERRRCSQAAALALALPAKLGSVARVLALEHQKDDSGRRAMLQMAQPRRPRKNEDPNGVYWFDDSERREQLYAYCKNDVTVERDLHHRIEGLIPEEHAIWVLDATINNRGIYIDGELLGAAIKIADAAECAIGTELQAVTGGAVETVHQTARLIAWLAEQDCIVTDVQKGTLKQALRRKSISPAARRAMELRLDGAHAAASKLLTMRAWRNGDGRARGVFRYHGASTGRWTSFGIQLQNLKRPLVEDIGAAIEAVGTGDLDHLRQRYPQPMSVVGDITRALICAAPNHRLIAADFSGIESRVTAWISGQQSKVDQWAKFDRTGDPKDEPYYIFGKQVGQPDETARAIGKTADLAFGYMGGPGAWEKLAGDDDTSTEAEIKQRQQAWRRAHPQTVKFWGAINRATIQAVRKPGTVIQCGRLAFKCDGTFLRMKLPSGRKLAYPFPKLKTTKYGDLAVVFMDNASGKWTECRYGHGAYGGTWIENAVQAVARDLFAAAMPRLEAAGYPIVLHVHDEIVCEVPDGFGSVEEFQQIMTTPPAWAEGLPIAAKVRNGQRFCKITTPAEPLQPQVGISGVAEVPSEASERTREPPIGSTSEHNPENDDDHGAHDDDLPPPDHRLPWSTPTVIELVGVKPWDVDPINYPPPEDEKPSGGNGHGDPDDFKQDGYPHGEQERGNKTTTFIYRDAAKRSYLQVRKFVRFVGGVRKKSFPQYHQENGQWVKGAPKGPRIPYRLPELLAAPADAVIDIMEGEKDADRGATHGLITTTNPGGASKWGVDLNQYFHGRRVRIHEDNDQAGRDHVIKIASMLHGIASEIRVVRYRDLKDGGDFSDFMDGGGTIAAMIARAEAAPHVQSDGYTLVRASDIVPRAMDWLWEGHILRGSQELLTGIPGGGKSQIHSAFVAYITTGGKWPDGCNGAPAGNAIMLTAEDCLDQIIVPRLIAAGAACDRIHILKKIRRDNKDRMFLLHEDLEELARAIRDVGDVRLITIDPITAYMGGKLDSHRTTDVRGQLGPLAELAERMDIAISAITHPPKHSTQRAIDHFIGSQAFIAAARIGHMAIEEMEEDEQGNRVPTGRSLFTNPKNNVSRKMPTLAYRVVAAQADDIPITKIVWEEIVDITADQAVAAASPSKGRDRQGVVIFLLDMLTNGPVPKTTIEERADAHGFSRDQLKYAKKKIGTVAFKEKGKFDGGWFWALPQYAPQQEQDEEETTT
jgi:DNA polymerase bacteriophage-type